MRVAVFAYRQVPKKPIYAVLDKLHGEGGLHVICWAENHGGAIAEEWAKSRPGAECNVVSNVKSPDTRKGGIWDKQAALITLYKTFAPDRALVFCTQYWVTGGTGKTILQQAERWSVPVHLYEPELHDRAGIGRNDKWAEEPEPRIVELCGKKSPTGKIICSRFRGHPTSWHWEMRRGERGGKFWLP